MHARCVLLLTYGEPPTPGFGDQLKYSWRILRGLTRSVAAIPTAVLPLIALKRALARTRTWSAEKYGSPLEQITEVQAVLVREELARQDPRTQWDVRAAYEFRDPLLLDAIRVVPPGVPVDVVPMYVTCSAFTHSLSRQVLDAVRDEELRGREVNVLPPLSEPLLAGVHVNHLLTELRGRGVRGGADWALLLAAHGTLLTPPRPIETGRVATERLCALITEALRGHFGRIQNCWLNHVYGGAWTRPAADEALADVVKEGYRKVVYYPYGFLADNAESQLEGRQVLRTQRGLETVQPPCLNEDRALAWLVTRAVAGRIPLRAARIG